MGDEALGPTDVTRFLHDVRAPARAMSELARWMIEDAQLGDTSALEEHSMLMRRSALRLNRLLDATAEYVRAASPSDPGPTRLDDVVASAAMTGINPRVNGGDVVLPVGQKDGRRLIGPLLENALTHGGDAAPEILASTHPHVSLVVRDRGPGIPIDLRHQALAPFCTLQPRDRVEGTGIGLSIVRRTAERCGGTLTLSGAPEGGLQVQIDFKMT